jgi:CMP-N-acetylneuraminic acid synthetase
VIPARGGSKGIPRKNLRKVHGKSLTEWAIISAGRIPFEKRVFVSSDDREILAVTSKYEFAEPSIRPDYLAGDRVADYQVLRFEMARFEEKYSTKANCIVMMQPTSPIRNPDTVNACISTVLSGQNSSAWTVIEVPRKFHPRKQLRVSEDSLDFFLESPLVVGRQELDSTFIRTGVCYAISRETLLNDDKLLGSNSRPIVCNWPHANVDELDDLNEAEKLTVEYDGILIPKGEIF